MCIWRILREGIFRRNSHEMGRSSTMIDFGRTSIVSSQQFQEEFLRQLTQDNLRELCSVFHMIDVSSLTVSRSLFKFMNKRYFRDTFKGELKIYDGVSKNPDRTGRKALSNCLKYHCFAVLSSYLDMMQYIHDPAALDNFLEKLAISHSFICYPEDILEMHDFLLKQFMKQEFGKYMNRLTRRSLKRFLRLVSTRLRFLMEQHCDLDNTLLAMQHQKTIVEARIEKINTFKEVFVNRQSSASSEPSFLPADAIYPGTSTGRRGTLDRRSC